MKNLLIFALSAMIPMASAQTAPQLGTTPQIDRNNGLFDIQFQSEPGVIRVYLPDDIRPGETVSGTVVNVPRGKTREESERNLRLLEAAEITFPVGAMTRAKGRIALSAAPMTQYCGAPIECRFPGGAAQTATLRIDPPGGSMPALFSIPKTVQLGRPVQISGPFDGDLRTTRAKIGPLEIPILAESPRQCVLGAPPQIGPAELSIQEAGRSQSSMVRFVSFRLQVVDNLIRVGQATEARIRVGGLTQLEQPISMLVVNHDPSIATLEGGDVVSVRVARQQVDQDGAFEKALKITGRRAGTYQISLRPSNPVGSPISLAAIPNLFEEGEDPGSSPFEVRLTGVPNALTNNRVVTLRAESLGKSVSPLAALFSIRREPNGAWQKLGVDSTPENGLTAAWNTMDFGGGTYAVQVDVAGDDGRIASDTATVLLNDPGGIGNGPIQFENREFARTYTILLSSGVMASESDIARMRRRASDLRGAADERRDRAREQDGIAEDEYEKSRKARAASDALIALDKAIEGTLGDVAKAIEALIKRIDELKGELAGKGDPKQIDDAVSGLQKEVDDCDDHCKELEKKIADLEKNITDAEAKLEDLADEVGKMFEADGWTGSARFDKKAGIIRWGFIGDREDHKLSDFGSPENKRLNDIRKEKNKIQKQLKKDKDDLQKAKDDLKACKEACERTKEALAAAKKAQEQKNEAAAKEAEIDGKVAELDADLAKLEEYLKRHPEIPKDLLEKLRKLRGQIPFDSAAWDDFKKELEDLIKRKQQIEEDLKGQADDHERKGDEAKGNADGLRGEANGLDDEARREDKAAADLEAERRRSEAKAAEDARKAEEERDRAAAAARRDCIEEFEKWIKDNIDRGILPDSALDDFKKWLDEHGSKIPDIVDAVGKALEGGAKGLLGKPGAGAGGVASGLTSLGAAIFYWWAEAKIKDGVKKLGKLIDERTKQWIALELHGQKPPKKCGVIKPKQNQSESWFYFRDGNRVLLFKITRDGGLECMGEMQV